MSMHVVDETTRRLSEVYVNSNHHLITASQEALVEGTDSISNYPPRSSFKNWSANDTGSALKVAPGFLLGIIVNTGGTTSTLTIYNSPTTTSDIFGIFTTTAQVYLPINAYMSSGIWVVLAGGAAANVTLVYV